MGNCNCINKDEIDNEINTGLYKHEATDSTITKLLLLGAGSSGKSTLFKQLKCIHGEGIDEDEKRDSLYVIRQNCVAGIIVLLKKGEELALENDKKYGHLKINIDENKEVSDHIHNVVSFMNDTFTDENIDYSLLKTLGISLKYLWNLKSIQNVYQNRNKFSYHDNLNYFYDKIEEIMEESYEPTLEDILKCRVRTTGINVIAYIIEEHNVHLYDVGGQRNERKKWIHLFENVTALIYVAALNHYDAVLFEDETKLSMQESIELFFEICDSKWFRKTEIILFLNKNDLFIEKLSMEISLDFCFNSQYNPSWKGPLFWKGPNYHYIPDDKEADKKYFNQCYKSALEFIKQVYLIQNRNVKKAIYVHVTTATDKNNIETVFKDIQHIVLRDELHKSGLMA